MDCNYLLKSVYFVLYCYNSIPKTGSLIKKKKKQRYTPYRYRAGKSKVEGPSSVKGLFTVSTMAEDGKAREYMRVMCREARGLERQGKGKPNSSLFQKSIFTLMTLIHS